MAALRPAAPGDRLTGQSTNGTHDTCAAIQRWTISGGRRGRRRRRRARWRSRSRGSAPTDRRARPDGWVRTSCVAAAATWGQTVRMQDALGFVIFGVVIVAAVVAVLTLRVTGKTYDQIGRGGMSLRDGSDRAPGGDPSGAVALRERDGEIRQMLEGRNETPVR